MGIVEEMIGKLNKLTESKALNELEEMYWNKPKKKKCDTSFTVKKQSKSKFLLLIILIVAYIGISNIEKSINSYRDKGYNAEDIFYDIYDKVKPINEEVFDETEEKIINEKTEDTHISCEEALNMIDADNPDSIRLYVEGANPIQMYPSEFRDMIKHSKEDKFFTLSLRDKDILILHTYASAVIDKDVFNEFCSDKTIYVIDEIKYGGNQRPKVRTAKEFKIKDQLYNYYDFGDNCLLVNLNTLSNVG